MITYHFIKSIINGIKNTFSIGFMLLSLPFRFIIWLMKKIFWLFFNLYDTIN